MPEGSILKPMSLTNLETDKKTTNEEDNYKISIPVKTK